jgi:hypothetical protein
MYLLASAAVVASARALASLASRDARLAAADKYSREEAYREIR